MDARILVLITISIWSFGPLVGKLLSDKSQFLVVAGSFSFTLLTFSIALIRSGGFKEPLRVLVRSPLSFWLVGPFGYLLYWLCFFAAYRAFPEASIPTILNYTFPIFTLLFSALFGAEKSGGSLEKGLGWLGMAIGFVAVVLVATHGDFADFRNINVPGLVAGLGAGASYGFFSAWSARVPSAKGIDFLFIAIVVSWLGILPFAWHEKELLLTLRFFDFLLILFLGAVVDGVGYFLWTKANRTATISKENTASILSLIFFLPLFSLLVISVWRGEALLQQVYFQAAVGLLLLSSVLCQRAKPISQIIARWLSV